MSKLEDSVRQTADGRWVFECPATDGTCTDRGTGRSWSSSNWPDRRHALDRGRQHFREHVHGELMQPMDEFISERGLTQQQLAPVPVSITEEDI